MTVDREKLYAEIWAEPMTKVATRYDVSSSFLARICERLKVPRPPRGHWARLQAGKASAQPVLPQPEPGDELEWSRDGEPRRVPRPPPQPPPAAPDRQQALARSKVTRPAIHPLVAGTQEHFNNARISRDDYLKPLKQLVVDVFVSKDALSAALKVASQLFLALEDRGHRVVLAPRDGLWRRPVVDHREQAGKEQTWGDTWRPARPTVVFVGTVAIGLTVFELSENVEVRWHDGKYVRTDPPKTGKRSPTISAHTWTHHKDLPSGRLCLRAFSPYQRASWEKQWREKAPGELHGTFDEIGRELERAARTIAKLVEEGERQYEIDRKRLEEQRREWELQELQRRREQAKKESRAQLLELVEHWALASRIEGFFADITRSTNELAADEQTIVVARLRLAREMFGGPDALQHFRSWRTPDER